MSFSLEWKGKKFVFSGDTVPNKWFFEESRNADLLIHERYFTIDQLINIKNYDPERARIVSTVIHTPPSSCDKIFAQLQPGMAVAYHMFNDFDTAPDPSKRTPRSDWLDAGRIDLLD